MPASTRRAGRILASLFLVATGLGLVALAFLPAQEKEDREVMRQRQDWFYGQRAYPHGHDGVQAGYAGVPLYRRDYGPGDDQLRSEQRGERDLQWRSRLYQRTD